MIDWEKLKVTELKDELKARGVPLTGLKLKQQLIDKLVEVETDKPETSGIDELEQDKDKNHDQSGSQLQHDQDQRQAEVSNNTYVPAHLNDAASELSIHKSQLRSISPQPQSSIDAASDKALPTNREENNASHDTANIRVEDECPTSFIPVQDTTQRDTLDGGNRAAKQQFSSHSDASSADQSMVETEMPEPWTAEPLEQNLERDPQVSPQVTATSTRLPTPEAIEEQRKRKRRSLSPPPDTQEMQKRVKRGNGQSMMTRQESEALDTIKTATALVQDGREAGDQDEFLTQPMEASNNPEHTGVAKEVGGLPDASELASLTVPRANFATRETGPLDLDLVRSVSPALHPVTSSLYIRNLKRPLHIPSLRTHVSDLAKPYSDSDKDPVTLFYLDTIRTHAFISFASTMAAGHVRSQMHGARYPDEQMRDPLWVDFIPDDKVQSWIDQETRKAIDGFGVGRGTAKKFEVSYSSVRGVMEAKLQIASDAGFKHSDRQQQPNIVPQNLQASTSEGKSIRPDRVGLVALPNADHEHSRKTLRAGLSLALPRSDTGTGFKALDELFSFTLAKPKLYYKAVAQPVVDDRLDLLRNLMGAHAGLGQSGDEGMKRYTFDGTRGQQEWVDKGPEFGFGKKGQDRLEGFRGRGRGGAYRGRGRGGGSWRGSL